jgi:predicted HTH domain antitoxin
MQVTINIPDKFAYIDDYPNLAKEIKQDYALSLYRKNKISLSVAAEIAEMNIYEFIAECKKNNVPVINYTPEDLNKELGSINFNL